MPTEFKLYDVKKEDLFSKKNKNEKEKILKEMVEFALKYGNKPAARKYNTYPSTVRRWVRIYNEFGNDGLKYKTSK